MQMRKVYSDCKTASPSNIAKPSACPKDNWPDAPWRVQGSPRRGFPTRVNQTRVNQTRVNQTRVNQTRVNQTRVNQTRVNQTRVNQTRVNQTTRPSPSPAASLPEAAPSYRRLNLPNPPLRPQMAGAAQETRIFPAQTL